MAGRDTLLISVVAAAVLLSVPMLEAWRMIFVTQLSLPLWMDRGFGLLPLRKEIRFRLPIQVSPTSDFLNFFPAARVDRMYIYEVVGACWIILLVFSTAVCYRCRVVECSSLFGPYCWYPRPGGNCGKLTVFVPPYTPVTHQCQVGFVFLSLSVDHLMVMLATVVCFLDRLLDPVFMRI